MHGIIVENDLSQNNSAGVLPSFIKTFAMFKALTGVHTLAATCGCHQILAVHSLVSNNPQLKERR